MNSNKTSRNSQFGHYATAFGLALAINSAVAMALLHTPTEGQRYLRAAAASADASTYNVATANCVKGRG